jgi:hypothetical protein
MSLLSKIKFSLPLVLTSIAQGQIAIYVISGLNLPATCSVAQGQVWFKTTGGAGVEGLYQCGPTDNSWTYVGGAGSSGVSSFNSRTGAVTTVSGDIPNNAANTTGNAATATNLASYPTLCTGTNFSQGLSSGSNNCAAAGSTTNQNLRQFGAVLTPSSLTACVFVAFSGTINAFHAVVSDGATAATVLVKIETQPTFATFISTGLSGASDITNGGEQLTTVLGKVDTTLTSWTTSFAAGTTICMVASTFSAGTSINANITMAAN